MGLNQESCDRPRFLILGFGVANIPLLLKLQEFAVTGLWFRDSLAKSFRAAPFRVSMLFAIYEMQPCSTLK